MNYNFTVPCCEPIESNAAISQFNELSPQRYTHRELENIPQCARRCPSPRPKCLTIQQPPHLICRKRVVFVSKIIPEPVSVNRCKIAVIPKVVEITKVIRVPKLSWVPQLINESRVVFVKIFVPDPFVLCVPRKICEPRTICQMLMCQPKPQIINIPRPMEYCCYPTRQTRYKFSVPCPRVPISGGVVIPHGKCHPHGPIQCYANGPFGPYPPCNAIIMPPSPSPPICNPHSLMPLICGSSLLSSSLSQSFENFMSQSVVGPVINTTPRCNVIFPFNKSQCNSFCGPFLPLNAFSMSIPQGHQYYNLNNFGSGCIS